jgi:hypothetical protein
MTSDFVFKLEDDPVPIVATFGTILKHSLSNPGHAAIARSITGCFSLASTTDPQSLTITIRDNHIHIRHGISDSAKIIVRLDFSKISEPGYKPIVEGLLRHPLFAYKIGRLLNFPESSWADDAKRFWDGAHSLPGMPKAIKFTSTDENRDLLFGTGDPEIEISGESKNLSHLLSGSNVLIGEVLAGRIRVHGSLHHLTILSEATLKMMLGEFEHG